MRKIEEYLQFAEECRQLAKLARNPEHCAALHQMAKTWIDLAAARQQELERIDRIKKLDLIKGPERSDA